MAIGLLIVLDARIPRPLFESSACPSGPSPAEIRSLSEFWYHTESPPSTIRASVCSSRLDAAVARSEGQRNLLYTGITRGKRLVVVIGSKRAMAIAVKNNKIEERNTLLTGRLRGDVMPTCC